MPSPTREIVQGCFGQQPHLPPDRHFRWHAFIRRVVSIVIQSKKQRGRRVLASMNSSALIWIGDYKILDSKGCPA